MIQLNLIPDLILFLTIVCRVGGMIMLTPGLGDHYISPRIKIYLVLALSFLLMPTLSTQEPLTITNDYMFLFIIVKETVIGLWIGFLARLIFFVLDILGTIISNQMGLSSAMSFDPTFAGQKSLIANFLSITFTQLFFVLNGHEQVIYALVKSYQLVPISMGMWPMETMVQTIFKSISKGYNLAIQLATPFLCVGLIVQMCLGFLSRLMPQLQIFFLGMPIQILILLMVLLYSVTPMMTTAYNFFNNVYL